MATYQENIHVTKEDWDRWQRLLKIESLGEEDKEVLEELEAKEDDSILLGSAVFSDGAKMDLFLASGQSNYYLDIGFVPAGASVLDEVGADYELDTTITAEHFGSGNSYVIHFVVDDGVPETMKLKELDDSDEEAPVAKPSSGNVFKRIVDLEPYTPETYYNELRADINNMSHWLPAIMPTEGETRKLRIPKTAIVQVPSEVLDCFSMEREGDQDRIIKFVQDSVMPVAMENDIYPRIFIKNGAFSDKFQFHLCTPSPDAVKLALNLIDINYDALCFDADGISEVCLREFIPYNRNTVPCIYSGMPLRPEYRVFYDFDRHEPLYIVNYWDWDYCHEAISRNLTDKIVYEARYPAIQEQFELHKDEVMEMVAADMANVTGLTGIWSVDVMYCEEQEYQKEYEGYWLIDMAIGPRSAYWDPEKIK